MNKRINQKSWFKLIASCLIVIFLSTQFSTPALARSYTKDNSLKKFFKSDAGDAFVYIGSLGLQVAANVVFPGSGTATSMLISAGVNVGSQIAVAAGADPKTVMIVGAAVGALTQGIINLKSAPSSAGAGSAKPVPTVSPPEIFKPDFILRIADMSKEQLSTITSSLKVATDIAKPLSTATKFWTVAGPTLTWTAIGAAQSYAGEKNPLLGMAVGMLGGTMVSAGLHKLAKATGGGYFDAHWRSVPEDIAQQNVGKIGTLNREGNDTIHKASEELAKLDKKLELEGAILHKIESGTAKIDPLSVRPSNLAKITNDIFTNVSDMIGGKTGINPSVTGIDSTLDTIGNLLKSGIGAKVEAASIKAPWYAPNGTLIADMGLGDFVKLAPIRTISPGEWIDTFIAAGIREALGDAELGQIGPAVGSVIGGAINQCDGLGKMWAGTKEEHSPWYDVGGGGLLSNINPISTRFLKNALPNTAFGVMDYALSKIKIVDNYTPVTNAFSDGLIKLVGGSLMAGVVDKIYPVLDKTPVISAIIPTITDHKKQGFFWGYFKAGLSDAYNHALPLQKFSGGIDAGYNYINYILRMNQRFANPLPLPLAYAFNWGAGMDNATAVILSSAMLGRPVEKPILTELSGESVSRESLQRFNLN